MDFRKETDKINQYNALDYYNSGHRYDILIVYPDSGSIKTILEFTSLMDLCDSDKPLIVREKKNGLITSGLVEISKTDIQFFIFDNKLLFKKNRQKEFEFHSGDRGWGLVEINGPVMVTKRYYLLAGSVIESEMVVKCQEFLGISPESMGGFFFKKNISKRFSDFPELSKKIYKKEKGYTSKHGYEIIKEYNEWVNNNEPEMYEYYLFH